MNSKENISPNLSLDYRPIGEVPRPYKEISPPSVNSKYQLLNNAQSMQGTRERPNSARDSNFEFNQNPSQSHDAHFRKKKRRMSSKRKHKVNTDNEIKIHKNTSYGNIGAYQPQVDPEESDDVHSDHTAINLNEQKMEVPVLHPKPVQHTYVTMDHYQYLANENSELKATLKSLAQTVSMLVSLEILILFIALNSFRTE
jgi:hypothetical protein